MKRNNLPPLFFKTKIGVSSFRIPHANEKVVGTRFSLTVASPIYPIIQNFEHEKTYPLNLTAPHGGTIGTVQLRRVRTRYIYVPRLPKDTRSFHRGSINGCVVHVNPFKLGEISFTWDKCINNF